MDRYSRDHSVLYKPSFRTILSVDINIHRLHLLNENNGI